MEEELSQEIKDLATLLRTFTDENDFDFQFQLWRKEKQQQKFIGEEPTNYLNRKVGKEEQMPITTKKSQKRKMLEEKLEENTIPIKRLKKSKSNSK